MKRKKKPPCSNPLVVPRTDCTATPKRITPAEASLYGLAALLTSWLLFRGYTPQEALWIVSSLLLIVVTTTRVNVSAIRRVAARMLGPA